MPSLSYMPMLLSEKKEDFLYAKKFPCELWTCDFTAHRKGLKAKTSSSYSLLWTPRGEFTNYPGGEKTGQVRKQRKQPQT